MVGEGEMGWFIQMLTKQAGCSYRNTLAGTGWAISTDQSTKIWCYVYSITQLYIYCIFCVYANELRKTKLLLCQLLRLTRNKQNLSWDFRMSFSELSSFPSSCVEEGKQSRVPSSVALVLILNLVNTPKIIGLKYLPVLIANPILHLRSDFLTFSTYLPFNLSVHTYFTIIRQFLKIPNFGYQYALGTLLIWLLVQHQYTCTVFTRAWKFPLQLP